MSTGTQTCEVVLPGYTLTERIGTGGYAEVWRAEAPGGIEKAVKIVYGYYDDEFASQELKALERIKGVRHPFLLSLERFEILNGRLAILTELADMSLDQRLRQCRGDGLIGIPRDELLRYMADAAEALDFLAQRHSLLHLDIKPENLLVLGDHIKVADFGLVKEIATRTQNSLVSGMTPTYAAPEIFDDDPSAQSDQYSLAIVYQEMLVGTLPFPGRTAAQLAKQHTQAEPQLASLPADDREVISKALAKKPSDRFESCKAFIDALQGRCNSAAGAAPFRVNTPPAQITESQPPIAADTSPATFHPTEPVAAQSMPESYGIQVTQPVCRHADDAASQTADIDELPAEAIPEKVIDVDTPPIDGAEIGLAPTLYIAAGGVGITTLCRLRAHWESTHAPDQSRELIQSIAIDTDRDEIRHACSNHSATPLALDDTLHVPLKLPQDYDNSREILDWVSRRWLYNIPRSLSTRGYRPLGRVALIDHSKPVVELISKKLKALAASAETIKETGGNCHSTLKVVLLASTGGGTGSGMIVDLGNLVKSLASEYQLSVEVHACLLWTCLSGKNASPLLAANSFALLTELNHAAIKGNRSSCKKSPLAERFESNNSPVDFVYCIPATSHKTDGRTLDAAETVARYLSLETSAGCRAALNLCRMTPTERETTGPNGLKLRKLGYASLERQTASFMPSLTAELAIAVKRHWLTEDRVTVRADQDAKQTSSEDACSPANASPSAPKEQFSLHAVRHRFAANKSLEFASEVVRQLSALSESRDARGRLRAAPCELLAIADSARRVVEMIQASADQFAGHLDRFTSTAALRPLVARASRQTLSREIQRYDSSQPERCLEVAGFDERLEAECLLVLQEANAQAEFSDAIAVLIDAKSTAALALESASSNFLGCGSDRRTLILTADSDRHNATIAQLRELRPQAATVPADGDDLIIVTEESAISPKSIAQGLDRMYSGIAEAAHRLHTRTDIEWQKL